MNTKLNDPKIIVALDYPDSQQALQFVSQLNPSLCALKVGKELFTAAGPQFIEKLVAQKYRVFLDLKFHDIPTTVAKACKVAAGLGVWMIDIHAFGGLKMMEAARNAVDAVSGQKPLLVAVTVLTSFAEEDLLAIGIKDDIKATVINLAKMAQLAEIDGVVCSPQEINLLRENSYPTFTLVTPGIRLQQDLSNQDKAVSHDDQVRVMTPTQALVAGANYLVIGRPITQAQDPLQQLQRLNQEVRLI